MVGFRNKLSISLQIAAALLLLTGWWQVRYARVSVSSDMMLLLGLWLAGTMAGAVAWKVSLQRRLLSTVLILLNFAGVILTLKYWILIHVLIAKSTNHLLRVRV